MKLFEIRLNNEKSKMKFKQSLFKATNCNMVGCYFTSITAYFDILQNSCGLSICK